MAVADTFDVAIAHRLVIRGAITPPVKDSLCLPSMVLQANSRNSFDLQTPKKPLESQVLLQFSESEGNLREGEKSFRSDRHVLR